MYHLIDFFKCIFDLYFYWNVSSLLESLASDASVSLMELVQPLAEQIDSLR